MMIHGKRRQDQKARKGAAIAVSLALCAPLAIFALDFARIAWTSLSDASAATALAQRFVLDTADVPVADGAETDDDANAGEGPTSLPSVDWEALMSTNADAVGWVHVPATRVSNAIVQAPASEPERYLSRDLSGNANQAGCPYVSAACAPYGGIDARFVVIYGHNLASGGMFSDFARYADAAYAEDHRAVFVLAPAGTREATVVGANVVDADIELIAAGFDSATDLEAYLREKLAESEVAFDLPGSIERIYAFVCCSYQGPNHRTIVYAVETQGNSAPASPVSKQIVSSPV